MKAEHRKTFESEILPLYGLMRAWAYDLTKDKVEMEDLCQKTFLKAINSMDKYQAGTKASCWIKLMMKRLWLNQIDLWEARSISTTLTENLAEVPLYDAVGQRKTPEDIFTDEEFGDEILSQMEKVKSQFREVVLDIDYHELSYKECQEKQGIPLGTVMSRLARGRFRMRMHLADHARQSGIVSPENPQLIEGLRIARERGLCDA